MKTKHTPGPWTLYNTDSHSCTIEGKEDGRNSTMHIGMSLPVGNFYFRGKEFEANARLIAAAPEMLELLKSVFCNRKLLNDEHFSGVADKLFKLIDNVIAKAEGNETK